MNTDARLKAPNENLGYLVWQVTMLWQRKKNSNLSKVDLTYTQFVMLASLGWLLKKSKHVTQKELADFSNTDRMMVSKVLRTLQNKELVDRKEHDTDTRAKCVFLTEKGKIILGKAFTIKLDSNNEFFKSLSDKERFMDDLKEILNKV